MHKRSLFANIALAFAAIIVAAGIVFGFLGFRRVSVVKSGCVSNLQIIEWCKYEWMSQNHKTINDAPNWNDLKIYFEAHGWTNERPVCPQGGTYTLGRGDEDPRCSIGGPSHSLIRSK
jgi:hypothetical protein